MAGILRNAEAVAYQIVRISESTRVVAANETNDKLCFSIVIGK